MDERSAPPDRPRWMWTAPVLAGVAVVLLFVGFMLLATDTHFVPQVTDLYVVCQYAKAMADGHPFRYNPGEPPSTGSTSVLHTAVLALAHALGARGEGLVAFAIVFGAALYLLSILLAGRIGRLLAGAREGLLAGGLVALGGPVVWGFLYGSDVALAMFLALWLLDRWLSFWRDGRAGALAAAGALLAVARPEGLALALMLGAASTRRVPPPATTSARLVPWLPALAGLLLLVMQRAMTGDWLGSSVSGKSLLPNYGFADSLGLAAEYGVDVLRGLLLGLYPPHAPIGLSRGWASFGFPPMALLLILAAAAGGPVVFRPPLRLWLLAVAGLFALVGPNVFMGVHFNRYLMWAFPGLLALTAAGLGVATRLLARDDARLERSLFAGLASLFLAMGLLSTLRFANLYGQMAGEIYRREVPTAEWIKRALPGGVAMANVVTSIEYLTGHRNLNLHGVMTPAFFGTRTVEKEAGLFEALNRLPAAELPPFLISTVSAQESSALLRELVAGEPLYRSFSLGDDLLVFRARWDLVGRSGRLYRPETRQAVVGLTEVDRLNVCDVRDEAAHGYRYVSRRGDLRLAGAVRIAAYQGPAGSEIVADAGRPILGSETFRVRTARGRDLVVVFRTSATVEGRTTRTAGGGPPASQIHEIEVPEAGMIVRVGGRCLAPLAFPNGPGWSEHVFRIPGDALADGTTELALSGRYASFYYWLYQ